jgi:transcription antitermination factor NusG
MEYPVNRKQDLENAWIAVQVRAMREIHAAEFLSQGGYECFVPLRRDRLGCGAYAEAVLHRSHPQALFPGYFFCRYKIQASPRILDAPGVIRILASGGMPYPMPDDEMDALFRISNSGYAAESCQFLHVGQWVRIVAGSLCGLRGIVTMIKDAFCVLMGVTLLNRSVAVEVDRLHLIPESAASLAAGVQPQQAMRRCPQAIG